MMQPGYLFIGNSSKLSQEKAQSLEPIEFGNVTKLPGLAAISHGFKFFSGTNRENADQLTCVDFPTIFYHQHIYRNIFAIKDNRIAYKNLCEMLSQHPEIEVLHCNTPIGGFVGRLAGRKYKVKKILYTAHGFHFYKGSSLFSQTVIKWIEKWLAHYTDVIFTMNKEDFEVASKFKLRNKGKVFMIPGVGVDTSAFYLPLIDKSAIRASIGIPEDAYLGIAMGDIIKRKNYETAIKAIALSKNKRVHYMICGRGTMIEALKELAKKLGVTDQVHFLGFRSDIKELVNASDFFLFCSYQEGLPRSMMEAMSAGLPCIVSKIRGHVDLMSDYSGGRLIAPNDANGFADAINELESNPNLAESFRLYNLERIKQFDTEVVLKRFNEIFDEIL